MLPSTPELRFRERQLGLNGTSNGLRFNEVLDGFLLLGNSTADFVTASEMAKAAASSAQLSITVALQRLMSGAYQGSVTGTLACGALSQEPLMITQGSLLFFNVDPDVSDATNLTYRLGLISTNGDVFTLHAYKRIDSSIAFSPSRVWSASTTLYTTISGDSGAIVVKGVMKISPRAFLSELLSFHSDSSVALISRIWSTLTFLAFFARNITSYAFSPFRPLQYPSRIWIEEKLLKTAKPMETWVMTDDGVQIRIKMWEPSPYIMRKATPIVLIPGASVTDEIFSLPTIPTNTIDYFTSQGYRCYVPILRFGNVQEAKKGYTVFDSRLDIKAALQYIRKQENNKQIYSIVHCLGSIAMATALFHGEVQASWFCGMTCSQVFTNLHFSADNGFKARRKFLPNAYKVSNLWALKIILIFLADFLSCRLLQATGFPAALHHRRPGSTSF